ncbi:hypothetical protein [Stenotrophobium rhamnosiphilum]|uniref:Lipoprotein n=1 Tax=Stenotrophobium rhamnosiphilum TaxID=2029166 RepID=A0A2T5MJY3_9GAMM|nr:hypothetical protein [Stenotrophobium rhamnosiphilum]PTU32880.1 hypothetical protein CJD38_01840 [Stenotrophobium rhamnosiphilum]
MRHILTPVFIASSLLFAACDRTPPVTPIAQEPQGREETQGIRKTDSIGYAGSAIADKVDGALNANDNQKAKTDQALQNAE